MLYADMAHEEAVSLYCRLWFYLYHYFSSCVALPLYGNL